MSSIIEKLKEGMTPVHCKTEDQAKEFVRICYDNGIEWKPSWSDKNETNWSVNEEDTCYRVDGDNLNYANNTFYKLEGYEIITFEEFMEEYNMKYQVGDKVLIRSDLVVDECYGELTWLDGMEKDLSNKVLTIERTRGNSFYDFKETYYTLSEDMIQCKVRFKIKCTRADDDKYEVGKEYYIDDKGFFTDKTNTGCGGFEDFEDWYDNCHWTNYDFKLVEDYTKVDEEECEVQETKYKVGDYVKFDRSELKGVGKIVEVNSGWFGAEYLIELPKELHGQGHDGNDCCKGNYEGDNYWYVNDDTIECKVDGSEFESAKVETKVTKFKVGDRVRANAKSDERYSLTNLKEKYEGEVTNVHPSGNFDTKDGFLNLEPEYFDLIEEVEESKHETEFIEPASEEFNIKDQFLYDHKVKSNGDIVFNKVKMLTLCFVKYNHWGKVYTFINPTGKMLKEGTKVLVDSAGRNDVAYVVASAKVQAKHVDGLVYAMTGKKHLELKNVLGVYEVKTKVKEFEVLKKF